MTDENDTAEAVVTDDTPEVDEPTPEVTPEVEAKPPSMPNLCGGCSNWQGGSCAHFLRLVSVLETDDFQFTDDCPEYEATPPPESPKE